MSAGDWKDLYQAACDGDLPRLVHHLREGVNPNYQHPEVLCTPLVAALLAGHLAVARQLLDHGADPQLVSHFHGLTPLQAAEQQGHVDLAALLRARGAQAVRPTFWRRWLGL
jgi:ankyrin repeat protein